MGGGWCSLGWNGWGFCNDQISIGRGGRPTVGPTETWRGGNFRVGTKFDNIKLLGTEQAERQLVLTSAPFTTAADWAGHAWTPHNWDGHRWQGHRWVVDNWDGHRWAAEAWAGHSWLASNFDGHRWAGHRWVGHRWAGHSWVDDDWS
jgi:hypothetical protein